MEKPGKQLFIFSEDGGAHSDAENKTPKKEQLSYPEQMRKEILFTELQGLKDKFGEINNQALLEGGYFRRPSNFIQQEIDWINEFAGDDIVQVSDLDNKRMTWVPKSQDEDLGSVQEAA